MKITLEPENEAELEQMKGQMKAERFEFEGMANFAIVGAKTLIGTNRDTKQQEPIGIQPVRFTWMDGGEGASLLIGFLETTKMLCQEIRQRAVQAPQTPLIVPGTQVMNNPMTNRRN